MVDKHALITDFSFCVNCVVMKICYLVLDGMIITENAGRGVFVKLRLIELVAISCNITVTTRVTCCGTEK